jgi:hypothetical protein
MGVLGLYLVSELLAEPAPVDPVAIARGARPLRAYGVATPRPPRGPRPLKAAVALGLCALGVGMGVHGVRQLRRQGRLLTEGIPVVGMLTDVRVERRRPTRLTYRFRDDAGVEHEGFYDSQLAGILEYYSVGQEVTVLYDAADPRQHMLDVDDVRRVDARVRHL